MSEINNEFRPEEKKKEIERLCNRFLDEIASMGISSKEVIPTLNKIIQQRTKVSKRDK